MADVFTRAQRSAIMSRVKGRGNAATELRLVAMFKARGIHGWRRHAEVFGRPDLVFYRSRVAVFVDGCFWHGCPRHGSLPSARREFWRPKLEQNRTRDALVNRGLTDRGWRVLRIWQHELLRRNEGRLLARIERTLRTRK
jgi:DNA mismatch endonuclease (patch repair protein)